MAIVLAIGAGVVWGFACGFSLRIIEALLASEHTWEQLVVLRDGTLLIQSPDGYRTLDGKRLDSAPGEVSWEGNLPGPNRLQERFWGLTWRDRIVALPRNPYASSVWFFQHDGELHGHGFCVGFDTRTNLKVGYIGLHGFRPDEPPPEDQFPIDGRRVTSRQHIVYLPRAAEDGDGMDCHILTDNALIRINLKGRTVHTVRELPDAISATVALKAATAQDASANATPTHVLLLRTRKQIVVLDANYKQTLAYPLPEELHDANLQCFLTAKNELQVHRSYQGGEVLWIDTAGKIVRRLNVDLRPTSTEPSTWNTIGEIASVSIVLPCPAPIASFIALVPGQTSAAAGATEYSVALRKALNQFAPILLITTVISIILSVLSYRRQRRFGLPWTWMWTVFVLLFGLPAYFGYLAHRQWPARLPCPHCGKRVPRDRPACFACGHDFPAPALKGIEVFA
jgi:hypothetical protein